MSFSPAAELLETLAELSRLYPDMRFGQLLEMIALLSSDDIPQVPPSLEDETLLQAAVAHRFHRLKQLGVERSALQQKPILPVRNDLLQALHDLHYQHPDSQMGQFIAKLAEESGASLYDVEDKMLLILAQQHLSGTLA